MAAGRPIFGLLALLFTAGAILLMFLTFLGGANHHRPLNEIYFLQANTSNIPGAPAVSRWTFWNVCSVDSHGKSHCGTSHPTFPFDPPGHNNFNTDVNVPHQFIGTNHFYLMSRFMFPFEIIALFFAVCSLFLGLLAPCTRIGSYLSSTIALIAWVFQVITTCLMTACYVKGRDHFNSNGQRAKLGRKAFAFMWTAVFLLTLSSFLYCMGGVTGRGDAGYSGRETRRRGFFTAKRSPSTRSGASTANGRKEYA